MQRTDNIMKGKSHPLYKVFRRWLMAITDKDAAADMFIHCKDCINLKLLKQKSKSSCKIK